MIEKIRDKYLLVDTCVISGIFYNIDEFEPFLNSLTQLNCHPCINEFVYLEFIRIASNKSKREEIEKLLGNLIYFPANEKTLYNIAKEIYPLYNFCSSIKNPKQVSIVDVLNVAYLKKYKDSLFYITFDNNDFPLELLERVETGTVDVKSQIFTWGLYKFNEVGYKKLLEIYNKN
jgi:hypothetical protein